MQNITHRQYVRSLYKHLLSEAGIFFDDRARTFMINRIKYRFRACRSVDDIDRIKSKIIEGRKALNGIERANANDRNCVMRILEAAYGRWGKVRHSLLMPYIEPNPSPSFQPPEPFYPHIPHTAPPAPLCLPLQILITKIQNKKLEPELPEPKYKPLHLGRKANLLWAWRTKLLMKTQVPLPLEILHELESKALLSTDPSSLTTDGGPRWDLMYGPKQRKYQIDGNDQFIHLAHLDPNAKLLARSKFKRSNSLPMSPYSNPFSVISPFSTTFMLDVLENGKSSLDQHRNISKPVELTAPVRPRQLRRHYQRLFTKIPCMTGLTTREALWDQSQRHTILESLASNQLIRRVLKSDELPSQEVMEQSLLASSKKIRRHKPISKPAAIK